jgi:hypothetical protein
MCAVLQVCPPLSWRNGQKWAAHRSGGGKSREARSRGPHLTLAPRLVNISWVITAIYCPHSHVLTTLTHFFLL